MTLVKVLKHILHSQRRRTSWEDTEELSRLRTRLNLYTLNAIAIETQEQQKYTQRRYRCKNDIIQGKKDNSKREISSRVWITVSKTAEKIETKTFETHCEVTKTAHTTLHSTRIAHPQQKLKVNNPYKTARAPYWDNNSFKENWSKAIHKNQWTIHPKQEKT